MKIVSFGDSFIFGSELDNNPDGRAAWPGLIAEQIQAEYQTMANPGCGNDDITRQIFTYFSENSAQDTLAVINWTWAARWDFYVVLKESWISLGLTCVPDKLKNLLDNVEAEKLIDFYKTYTGNSILWNRWRSLQSIHSAQSFMNSKGVKSIQTYMDPMIWDQTFHAPVYVRALQDITRPAMTNFEGENFLDWSHAHGFAVSDPGWHPLEQAHRAAADLWQDRYVNVLRNKY
jgi:hypothetical protein